MRVEDVDVDRAAEEVMMRATRRLELSFEVGWSACFGAEVIGSSTEMCGCCEPPACLIWTS
jgi:hypothetical protein